MSGGSFDYAYSCIMLFADGLRNKLEEQGKDSGGYGNYNPAWTTEVACKLAALAALATHVALLAKEAEWLYSGDIGETTFMERVNFIETTQGIAKLERISSQA